MTIEEIENQVRAIIPANTPYGESVIVPGMVALVLKLRKSQDVAGGLVALDDKEVRKIIMKYNPDSDDYPSEVCNEICTKFGIPKVSEAQIISCALEAGFMITTECGQESNKLMPRTDKATLVKFVKALLDTKKGA